VKAVYERAQEVEMEKAQVASDRSKIIGKHAGEIATAYNSWKNTHQKIEDRKQKLTKQLQSIVAGELSKTRKGIDPDRKRRGFGRKLHAGIAVALGAMGSALARQPGNAGLSIINDIIDRDIAAQQEEIRGQERDAAIKTNLVGRMIGLLDNEHAGLLASKAMRLEQFEYELKRDLAKTDDAAIQANLQEKLMLLQKDKFTTLRNLSMGLYKMAGDNVTQQLNIAATGKGLALQEKGLALQERKFSMSFARAMQSGQATLYGFTPIPGTIQTDDSYKEIPKKYGKYLSIVEKLDEAIKMRNMYGAEVMPGAIKTMMKSIDADVLLTLKDYFGMGANWTQIEVDKLNDLVGGVGDVGWVMDKLKRTRRAMTRDMSNTSQAMGWQMDPRAASLGYQVTFKERKVAD
jgi:hypothetical protein